MDHSNPKQGGVLMAANIGLTGFTLIIAIALILFSPKKLPALGRAFGTTIKELKKGAKDMMVDAELREVEYEQQRAEKHTEK